jgi:hypothetical protein
MRYQHGIDLGQGLESDTGVVSPPGASPGKGRSAHRPHGIDKNIQPAGLDQPAGVANEGKPGLLARNPGWGRVSVRAWYPSGPLRAFAVATELPAKQFPKRFRRHAVRIKELAAVEMIGHWSGIASDARGHFPTRLALKRSFRQGPADALVRLSEFLDFSPLQGFKAAPPLGKKFFSTRRPVHEARGQRPTALCALGRECFWIASYLRSRDAASRRIRRNN